MRAATRCLLVGLMFVWTGCAQQRKHYVIEMSAQDDGLARTLTCWLETGGQPAVAALPQDELARLAKLYGRPGTTDAIGRRVFTAAFDDETPSDVGGAGVYARYATPLGTLWTYTERFRGNADLGPGKEKLESDLARQRAAADQLVDLVSGWLQQEMGQDPAFPRLRQFLDKDFRGDLKSLLLLGWTHHVASAGDTGDEEIVARAVQFLIERGYLAMSDLPAVMRIELSNDSGPFLALARRLLARKMGLDDRQAIPPSLAFLSTPGRAGKSFASYAAKTEFFQKRLEGWKQRQASRPKAGSAAPGQPPDAEDPEPAPDGILVDLLDEMVGDWLDLQAVGADSLTVRLHCATEPLASNGTWDEETKTLVWSSELKARRLRPMFCFAVWCRPNEAAQKEHFGGLVLEDEDLAEYAMWYCGLTKSEAQEWDRFVATLRHGGNWRLSLEKFRFSSDPRLDPANPQTMESLADEPKALILGDDSESQPAPAQPAPAARGKAPAARGKAPAGPSRGPAVGRPIGPYGPSPASPPSSRGPIPPARSGRGPIR